MPQTVKRLPAMRETWVQYPGREDPLEKEMATYSSILARIIHGKRSLAGHSPWVCRVRQLSTHALPLMLVVFYWRGDE